MSSCKKIGPEIIWSDFLFDPHSGRDDHALYFAGPFIDFRDFGIADYFASKDIVLNPDMRMQSIEAVKRSVMNNLGIAYIPIFAIREELRSGALIAVDTEIKDRMYTSVCVYHKNKWMSPQMKLALKLLDERREKEYV